MRKILSILVLGILMFLISALPAYASPIKTGMENTGVLDTYIAPSESDLAQLDKEQALKNKELEDWKNSEQAIISPEYTDIYYSLPVTCYQQEYKSWCGPASVKQSLSFHKAKSGSSNSLPSQQTLASKSGTTDAGANTLALKNTINTYSGTFGSFIYACCKLTGSSYTRDWFIDTLKYELSCQTNAPIIMVYTQYIPRYKGHVSTHYITISGYHYYNYYEYTEDIEDNDPNNNNAYYGWYSDPAGTQSESGIYCAGYQAGCGTKQAYTFIY